MHVYMYKFISHSYIHVYIYYIVRVLGQSLYNILYAITYLHLILRNVHYFAYVTEKASPPAMSGEVKL